ncbi:cytochrome c4, partial [Pseudomonas sp. FSL R10-0071]|nr:cytochrome c4 [Pseudomonas sp. FSL R10-0071]
MNKFFVSLLLTMGVSGIAQAASTALVGDAAAGQAKTAV